MASKMSKARLFISMEFSLQALIVANWYYAQPVHNVFIVDISGM
jgi:hypothetical protein